MISAANTSDLALDQLLATTGAARLRQEMALVEDLVDVQFYVANNPQVKRSGLDPVEHFCRLGWRELRKPSADFDVWWYWAVHLDPAADAINPLVHYALVGREQGLSTRPSSSTASPARALPSDRPVRRACLVAGFDTDGVVDLSVVELIADLARHGDVFYLFDGHLAPAELAKLAHITEGAWSMRHASYDFGSYSRLASELVGWDRLAQYDEVVFVNDSCFLVRPLDEVFTTMAARECDWWGLQATKGMVDSPGLPAGRIDRPIPIETVRAELLEPFEQDPVYTFHVGSYFLVFRRPVIESPIFRKFFESVVPQQSKRAVVVKYEMGLTHLLIGHGFSFDTYIDTLYPFHPMFSEWYFEMLERGFPLLKRFFIYRNHYDVPGLAQWKERVLAVVPDADVDLFEQTLVRSAPDDDLRRSFAITRADDGSVVVPEVVRGADFDRLNRKTSKRPDWWVFAVDPTTHRLPDNSRAIFEAVKDDPAITKIVLTRARRPELTGTNVVVEPVLSPHGRELLMRSGRVFVGTNSRHTLTAPVLSKYQTLVVVREGLQLEKAGRASSPPTRPDTRPQATDQIPLLHPVPPATVSGLLVASDVDQLAALATNWPATFAHVWRTGIPAHDHLLGEEESLPHALAKQLAGIREQLRGRRLLLFTPTHRVSRTALAPYAFSNVEIEAITSWCSRHGFVLGLRESDRDLERAYSVAFGEAALDLSHRRFPSVHAVLRSADALLTDYSGTALDFAITGRPVMSFAHDLEVAQDRLLYDLDHFFPGPVCRDFEELEATLDAFVDGRTAPHHARVREMLVDCIDARSTERVLAHLATLDGGEEL